MHRLLQIAIATLILAGFAENAAAATWRLAQAKGETITLTVTDTAIHILARGGRIEIPVANVQSLRITTHYLNPFEKWESWQPEGHDQREPSLVLDAIAENGGEGVVLMLGAGAMGAAGVASAVVMSGTISTVDTLSSDIALSAHIGRIGPPC